MAKNVFQICALDKHNNVIFNKKCRRNELAKFLRQQPPSPVYMEACYSSHYWARRINQMGHSSFLIPAQHVTPFVRGNKNDHNDALAIAEASKRPNLRFVPIKTEEQQEILSVHRIRQRLIKCKTQVTNQTRGLLADFGIIFGKGDKPFKTAIYEIESKEKFSLEFRQIILSFRDEYNSISDKIKLLEDFLKRYAARNKNCEIVSSIPGCGLITTTALVAKIDKRQAFRKPSEPAVWVIKGEDDYMIGFRGALIVGLDAKINFSQIGRDAMDKLHSMFLQSVNAEFKKGQ